MTLKPVPRPDQKVGLLALKEILRQRSIIGAMEVLHREMGNAFRLNVPGFDPVVLVGPDASRFVLVTNKDDLRWRMERDPITLLLGHGLLVEDEMHDRLRQIMNPALHKNMLVNYVETMRRCTDQITQNWAEDTPINMLVEMRKIALLILTETLFGADFSPELQRLWPGVLSMVRFISPGAWVLWRGFARFGYDRHLRQIDAYLYHLIAERRRNPSGTDDMLSLLIHAGLHDDLIRDQLMTMLVAGHDTVTASLTWALYLLGAHPGALHLAQQESRAVLGKDAPMFAHLGQLHYLDQAIHETLRLYPPAHLGSRVAAVDLTYDGYHIPAGTRVLYSIYLTQRDPAYWPNPTRFDPSRFDKASKQYTAFTYLPFGGGERFCIGATFAQVEMKIVLSRILQQFDLQLILKEFHLHMGATLEPRPGVMMTTKRV